MGRPPYSKAPLGVYKGLEGASDIPPNPARQQALCAGLSAIWQPKGDEHAIGCGGWLGSILARIRDKAEELDRLLLFAICAIEAGRPGHRLRLLPLRSRRLAIAFEVSKLLQELEEVE